MVCVCVVFFDVSDGITFFFVRPDVVMHVDGRTRSRVGKSSRYFPEKTRGTCSVTVRCELVTRRNVARRHGRNLD